ncbi:putative glucose-methanol-choline oxidoreductase, FAD/NAD(P)-binding domain superfamily [Septoria linicola]|nr:putative glucose-methanol-choline oxidoreductase, FAD/NAD(P)-binding domain superfamily [Septoria linicola]
MPFSTRALIALTVLLDTTYARPTQDNVVEARQNVEWDAIIVGAGPAGIVAADRMSEAGKRTLLLEQGGGSYYSTGGRERPDWLSNTELSRVDVPGLYSSIFSGSSSLLCGDKQTGGFGGCTIGGSSAINAELFSQPPASDFDTYYPQKWKSNDMNGAISKVKAKQPFTNTPSADGKRYTQSGYEAFKKWLGDVYQNVAINGDANNKNGVFGRTNYAYEKGQRSGPVKTYLQSAQKRSNFALKSGVQVERVQRNGGKATGVVAIVNGKTTTFKLSNNGRVILSGGSFFSPQLLMLSGIGDPAALSGLAKNKLLDLSPAAWINNTAVGDKLYDNRNTFIVLSGPGIQSYNFNYSSPIPADKDLYLQSRSGPLSSAGPTGLFWDSVKQADGSTIAVQGTLNVAGSFDFVGSDTITLNVYATSGAKSKSKIVLNEKGLPGPASDFLYSNPADADAVATVIAKIFKSLPKSGLKPLNIAATASKADILKYITTPSQYTRGYVNHWSGSCKIGACVDLDTKVKGMDNLHVVDSSITEAFTANPIFGIMSVAERASELILALDKK